MQLLRIKFGWIVKKIDAIDLQMLKILYQDSSLSNKDLAEKVHIAPSTCLERVKRMHQDEILNGFNADVDFKALGINLQAMAAISLNSHTPETINAFRDDTLQLNEVISLFHMGGDYDFLVHLAVSDAENLRDLIYKAFTSRAEVTHVETALVYEHSRSEKLPHHISN